MSSGARRDANGKWLPGSSANPETKWKPGTSQNPGGQSKTRKELRELARSHMPRAIERARELLDSEEVRPRDWLDAGRFLAAVSGLLTPPTVDRDDDASRPSRIPLTDSEREALARMALSSERQRDDGSTGSH